MIDVTNYLLRVILRNLDMTHTENFQTLRIQPVAKEKQGETLQKVHIGTVAKSSQLLRNF